ncbi:MAG TPA: hypothetical protein VFW11_22715 [Cyclobacteriaceae bacterium]|nr:hypothetical protein [Cyclobacteriaceae bacterium]
MVKIAGDVVGDKKIRRDSTKKKSNYDRFKSYKGQVYTGMKIGRSHKWNYDSGIWRETKVTPDRWELSFNVIKRRAGKAPKGSGVPVGTAYHWFILSHQFVEKLNANDYITSMTGLKFKLAHKRSDKKKWSVSETTQHKNLIRILKAFIQELEMNPQKSISVPLNFEYRRKSYEGVGIPVISSCHDGLCDQLDVTLNNKHLGIIKCTSKGWKLTDASQSLANAIGDQIRRWYG